MELKYCYCVCKEKAVLLQRNLRPTKLSNYHTYLWYE